MRRWAIVVTGIVVFVLAVTQILIPALGERRVENRLTENGGTADVTLSAVPAVRLLFGDGSRFEVSASGLDLGFDRSERVFDRLDGFGIVDVSIDDSRAGPFQVTSFELTRDSPAPYHLVTDATTSASALAGFGMEALDLPGESVAGALLNQLFGPDKSSLPVKLDLELTSDDGRVRVVSGGGTVAGLPAGPLAELITAAIVVEL